MSLSDLASLGSFVSGVAVLVSLIFLYFQLRQVNTQVEQAERNQRAVVQQGRVGRSSDQLFSLADTRLTSVWIKAINSGESLTDEESFQFLLIMTAMLRGAEDVYFQFGLGLLDERSLQNQLSPIRNLMRTKSGVAMWRALRPGYDAEFVARIGAMIPDQLDKGILAALSTWRDELAKLP